MSDINEAMKDAVPTGKLGIIALKSCTEMGNRINEYLVDWRRDRHHKHQNSPLYDEYSKDSFLIRAENPRFGTGEAKGLIHDSIRGRDLYLLVDVCNYSLTYTVCGHENHMSPDDHFCDLKRIIAAAEGKAARISVIMPFLYEGRQHKRTARESLDCALALEELVAMGVRMLPANSNSSVNVPALTTSPFPVITMGANVWLSLFSLTTSLMVRVQSASLKKSSERLS